jgi:uncharacterized protein YwgA
MYFMQEAGEPLRLKYKKASYGPYAENLRHVLKAIEGHFINGYLDGGDNPNKQIELSADAVDDASFFLEQHQDTLDRFNKVVNLVEGFESPFGLELLSTVHWVIKQDQVFLEADVIKYTYAWNKRKKQFTERQIVLAREILMKKAWL